MKSQSAICNPCIETGVASQFLQSEKKKNIYEGSLSNCPRDWWGGEGCKGRQKMQFWFSISQNTVV